MVRNKRRGTSNPRASRRRVLSSLAGAGASALFASVAPTTARATDAESADAESVDLVDDLFDALSLGTFESGLDDWRADGALDLARVHRNDRPFAVTEGERALEVTADGDPSPSILRPVGSLGLGDRPYFVADVTPGRVAGTDAPVAFRFRLYRPSGPLGGLELAAESDPVTVRQATPGRIYWDASDADVGLLDAVSALEIGWYPADREPADSTADGSTEAEFDDFAYRGSVVLDAIRATDSAAAVGSARLSRTMRDLQFDHGPYRRTEVTAESEAAEEGELVFADGATEAYRFETLTADRFRFTVSDTAVKLGGGW